MKNTDSNHCNQLCNQGRECACAECPPLATWEYIGAAIVVVTLTLLSVLIIAGGAGWVYGTLGGL